MSGSWLGAGLATFWHLLEMWSPLPLGLRRGARRELAVDNPACTATRQTTSARFLQVPLHGMDSGSDTELRDALREVSSDPDLSPNSITSLVQTSTLNPHPDTHSILTLIVAVTVS